MSFQDPLWLVMLPAVFIWNRMFVRHVDVTFANKYLNGPSDEWELGCAICAYGKALAFAGPVCFVPVALYGAYFGKLSNDFVLWCGVIPAGVVGLTLFVRFSNEYLALKK